MCLVVVDVDIIVRLTIVLVMVAIYNHLLFILMR